MAGPAPTIERPEVILPDPNLPLLEQGDRLSREEFERRYSRMPNLKKAELIEGTVYMPSPTRAKTHAGPQHDLDVWLGIYALELPHLRCFGNPTVRLDVDNEPQPDLVLAKLKHGQSRISADDYIEGAPELVVEIVGSTHAYDLHQKKDAYRRNGVREYIAWITGDKKLIWWELVEGEFKEIALEEGLLKSRIFPGLWLDVNALLNRDMKKVLEIVRQGVESPECKAFAQALK